MAATHADGDATAAVVVGCVDRTCLAFARLFHDELPSSSVIVAVGEVAVYLHLVFTAKCTQQVASNDFAFFCIFTGSCCYGHSHHRS